MLSRMCLQRGVSVTRHAKVLRSIWVRARRCFGVPQHDVARRSYLLIAAVFVLTTISMAETPKTPVVIELFTSEGCSSCPPADADLTRLAKQQPVAGADIIPLAWHIDYWDRLGWRDPFSSQLATARQYQYKAAFNFETVYTPQLVVDGSAETIGGEHKSATDAIAEAAKAKHADVRVSIEPAGEHVDVELANLPADEPLQLLVAITEDDLVSRPTRGENARRTLEHSAVVRSAQFIDKVAAGKTSVPLAIAKDWNRDHLHVVALIQSTRSRKVIGAATTILPAAATAGAK